MMTNSSSAAPRVSLATKLATMVGSVLIAGCSSLVPGPDDDTDPELVQRAGPRVTVKVADDAFRVQSPGAVTWGPGWSRGHARNLEAFFIDALTNSQGFYVIESGAAEIYEDEALREDGILADEETNKGQAERADLLLVCTLTKSDANAGGSNTEGSGGGLLGNMVPTFLKGGAGRSTQRAEVEIKVRIVDRRTRRVLATATGSGFSVGGTKKASVYGWSSRAIFGGGSDSSYENVDLEAAISRATVRAVNDLVNKIPEKYFAHE
jgi:curli biogenesis system outer membrane secretion channel CsgG